MRAKLRLSKLWSLAFDDMEGRDKFFNILDQYKGQNYKNFENSRDLHDGIESRTTKNYKSKH